MEPVSGWREVEIYGTFIRLTGELEVIGAERLSDSINRFGAFLQVRNSRAEPLSTNYPVLSRLSPGLRGAAQPRRGPGPPSQRHLRRP